MASNKTSIYSGVSKNKNGTFIGFVTEDGKKVRMKHNRETEKEAAMDRDIYILKHGIKPKKPLNFPRETYSDIVPLTTTEIPKNPINEPEPRNQFKSKIEPLSSTTCRLIVDNKPDAVVIIDTSDANNVCLYKWYITDRNYVRATLPGGAKIDLQRFLANPAEGLVVDHIDRNTLNNTKRNLRVVTPQENAQNQPLKINRTTKYRGVSLKNGKYIARANEVHIGSFDSPIVAAVQHDRYVVHNNLKMVELNFECLREEYLGEESYEIPKHKKESRYDGVTYRSNPMYKAKPYKAEHKTSKKRIFIWESADEEECAHKWDEYVVRVGLQRRRLNFPELYPNYGNPLKFKAVSNEWECEKDEEEAAPAKFGKPRLDVVKPQKVKTEFIEWSQDTYRLIIGNAPEAEVLIDKDQYDKIKQFRWVLSDGRITAKVAQGVPTMKLKRFIMNEKDPNVDIKYKSSNKLDNRIRNLRRVDKRK